MRAERMSKDKVPESFGVFKPVGHVVVAFAMEADREEAAQALEQAGFGKDVIRYGAEEMRDMTSRELAHAGALSRLGVEKAMVERYKALSESGYSWLVVYAPEPGQAQQVADVVKRYRADQAQKFGQMVIEELL